MSFYEDKHIRIFNKDCRNMSELIDGSVQCVVTSPPYWGLRKYSGEQDLIWGDNHCEHNFSIPTPPRRSRTENDCPNPDTISAGSKGSYYNAEGGNSCSLCGAWKGAFGLEPTPELYVEHTIEILREIRWVLRKDGVVFWNIGDSYASGKGSCFNPGGGEQSLGRTKKEAGAHPLHRGNISDLKISGLKPKDLCLIPFRIAIACQEDGWWCRSVIIWSKPNPMPESCQDRPTESHEYILMLTKSARYYWDADAVREVANYDGRHDTFMKGSGKYADDSFMPMSAHSVHERGHERWPTQTESGERGRNIRTVWEFPTQPYPEAHFAVFPEKLPEICIKAATPEVGCCSKCGSPWTRVLSKGFTSHDGESKTAYTNEEGHNANQLAKLRQAARARGGEYQNTKQTLGWQPTCKCNADKVPSIVLDPFAGAGTTLWVAKKLNRQAVGYEISEEYCELALKRNRQQVMI